MVRHPNYLGDLIMALAWSLPCGEWLGWAPGKGRRHVWGRGRGVPQDARAGCGMEGVVGAGDGLGVADLSDSLAPSATPAALGPVTTEP